jgi:hypothetical protein
MSHKTISINPSLFSVTGNKTKKNREKKPKPNVVPLISPNVLKNKLLKRIKEHKENETQNLENNKRKLSNTVETSVPIKPLNNELVNYHDEFTDSIDYLQTLSKQKRINDEKKLYDLQKQKRKEEIERRTIKNHQSLENSPHQIQSQINIDLPEELIHNPIVTEPFRINIRQDDVPYGVLKGGLKPSYREWAKTQRNNIVTNPNASLVIQGGNINSEKTARENRLNLLKQKIKSKIEDSKLDPLTSENLIRKPMENGLIQTGFSSTTTNIVPNSSLVQQNSQLSTSSNQNFNPSANLNIPNQNISEGKLIGTKHITKKTTKRKYMLGRSISKNRVGVLIKDRGTRKKILNAQKELKHRNINDVKLYLRQHNLIKLGSSAPNDVLRKLYESAMLSGEITNSNSDIILYNLTKENKEL